MENFRKPKKNQRKSSIDGFIVGSSPGATYRSAASSPQDRQSHSIGNFRAVDGFQPTAQNTLRSSIPKVHEPRRPQRDDSGRIKLSMPEAPPRPHKSRHWGKMAMKTFGV